GGTRHRTPHLAQVRLGDAVRGVGELVGEVAVVGEQQQALAVGVQPSDVEHPGGHPVQVVGDGAATLLVVHGGDHAAGLVERQVHQVRVGHYPLPVHVDHRGGRVDLVAQPGHHAVDRDPAVGDQLLAGPPGSDPGGGEDLLQPD